MDEDNRKEELQPIHDIKYIPVYIKVPFNLPEEEWENYIVDYIPIPYTLEKSLAFIVSDSAMSNDGIKVGSTVIVIEKISLDDLNNKIVAIMLKNSEVILRRLYLLESEVILVPSDPKCETFIISKKDLEQLRILGAVKYIVNNI